MLHIIIFNKNINNDLKILIYYVLKEVMNP